MKKSAYQLVNRGRKGKPCWSVEKDGKYCQSSTRKSDMDGLLNRAPRVSRWQKRPLNRPIDYCYITLPLVIVININKIWPMTKPARQAGEFVVDWKPYQDSLHAHHQEYIEEKTFTDYRKACAFAYRTAKRFGGSYLMPVIAGKKAAQWIYSDRYPRHFDV